MIARYSLADMQKVWTDNNKFSKYLDVELAAVKAFTHYGVVPQKDCDKILQNAKIDVNRIAEIEAETKHDVIAFTRCVCESLGEEKRWIHYGLTSSDVIDTAHGLLLREANDIIDRRIVNLINTLKAKAWEYKDVPTIGRTHGQHAEITSFGLKYALWLDELERNYGKFKETRLDVEVCKLSGAVGNYQETSIEIERFVAKDLRLAPVAIATQVISRDRYAFYIYVLAALASTLEKIATEIRSLARQEIGEVSEAFSSGQKGSSAMPHKRNPIGSENICGCARVMRSYVNVALENNILWDERDISHSSAERIILADSTTLLDYMLNRLNNIIVKLNVYPEKMMDNIYLTFGSVFSGKVLNEMVKNGWNRNDAYDIIQKLAFEAMSSKQSFREMLAKNKCLTEDELNRVFDVKEYLKNTESILRNLGIGGK